MKEKCCDMTGQRGLQKLSWMSEVSFGGNQCEKEAKNNADFVLTRTCFLPREREREMAPLAQDAEIRDSSTQRRMR